MRHARRGQPHDDHEDHPGQQDAAGLGLPLHVVELPSEPWNETSEAALAEALGQYAPEAVDGVAFGDLFIEDVRRYRAERLAETGFDGIWPLWGTDTSDLAGAVIEAGSEATLVAVDGRHLDPSFAGRRFDHDLLADLPADVDP
jgi:diphthamide synthase (EF-2-diphthine--ammonia ligase)